MALTDVEKLVYVTSDDIISDIVKTLVKELQRNHGVFTLRIYGGVFIALMGLTLISIITMLMENKTIRLFVYLGFLGNYGIFLVFWRFWVVVSSRPYKT